MRDYIVATWGAWDADDQGRELRSGAGAHRDRCVAAAMSRWWKRGRARRVLPRQIQVAPEMQSRGLGGSIVELLAAAAHAQGRPLVLRVLKVNDRARRFYERLGLRATTELEFHWWMTWPPASR